MRIVISFEYSVEYLALQKFSEISEISEIKPH